MIGFEEWWAPWPKKDAKKPALNAYSAARRAGFSHEDLIRYRNAYMQYCKDRGTDRNFILHAATFINQRRWTDEDIAKRLAPSEPLPLFVPTTVSTWNGSARKLIDVIGEKQFQAWFSESQFIGGTPPKILSPTKERRHWQLNKFEHFFRAVMARN